MGAILELFLHLSYLRHQQMDVVENLEDNYTVYLLFISYYWKISLIPRSIVRQKVGT